MKISNKEKVMKNKIEVESIQTCYHYAEYYWMIDRKPVVEYLDEYIRAGLCPSLSHFGSMLGLQPAWTGELEWKWENDFIWELIDSGQDMNLPILVCEDDNDLSCIIILVKVRRSKDCIYWDRIGCLNRENWDVREEQQSGILCLSAYTDKDWELYGDNIALEEYNSREYWDWVSENSYEEHMRRLRNYMKPYIQKEENINWIRETRWEFDIYEYEAAVKVYRKLYAAKQRTQGSQSI